MQHLTVSRYQQRSLPVVQTCYRSARARWSCAHLQWLAILIWICVLSLQGKAGIEPAAAQARSGRLGQPTDATAAQLSNGSGGGNGSGAGSMDSAQGQKQGHEGRSEEELIAAADWQLQRAHAQLRRAAEAEVRVFPPQHEILCQSAAGCIRWFYSAV